jgi:hypothetical protein
MFQRVALASILAFAACGDNLDQQPDAGTQSGSGGFVEAPHIAQPRLESLGGETLATPRIQPIFFTNDSAMQGQVESFLNQLSTSTYWTETTSEYGVGALTILPTIVETLPAPTSDAALQTYLATQLDGHHAGWTYDPQTIYSVFLPTGVVLSTPFGTSCKSFGAYHDEAIGTTGQSIVYALMPRCQGGLDTLTASTSHEFIEAATDPHVQTAPAFGAADPNHAIWGIVPGAETGDWCEFVNAAYARLVGNFVVQRTWSNASAAAGHDPCVPALPMPFMGVSPRLEDPTFFPFGPVWTHGITVAMGATQTVDVTLYTDAPVTTPFMVEAFDIFSSQQMPELQLSWDRQTGNNGDVLHLSITRNANDQFLGGNAVGFFVSLDGEIVSQWWGFVSQ